MAKRQIIEFEDAFLAAIGAKVMAAGAKTVQGYTGELTLEAIFKATLPIPVVLVMYAGSDIIRNGQRREEIMTFKVLVATTSLRAKDASGRTGTEAGAYDLLDATSDAVDGKTLFSDGFPVEFAGRQLLMQTPGKVIYGAEFEVRQAYEIN